MPIQIIITADHVTDAIAEIQKFATATGAEQVHKVVLDQPPFEPDKSTPEQVAPNMDRATKLAEKGMEEAKSEVAPKVEKLTRKEQDDVVAEMIEKGGIDSRFDLLTKNRQKKINDVLKEGSVNHDAPEDEAPVEVQKAEPETTEDAALENMFGDDEKTLTMDDIRNEMGRLGKGPDGKSNQDNLIKIRDILTTYIPEGTEIKVGNIPEAEYPQVHAELLALV